MCSEALRMGVKCAVVLRIFQNGVPVDTTTSSEAGGSSKSRWRSKSKVNSSVSVKCETGTTHKAQPAANQAEFWKRWMSLVYANTEQAFNEVSRRIAAMGLM